MTKRVLMLVEGQTEERFVKDVLAPAYLPLQTYIIPTLLITKRVKDGASFKGGVTNYAHYRNDVRRLLQNNGGALVTTLLDYYGLPADFPGMSTRPAASPIERVQHVEREVTGELGYPQRFRAFFALHEFEAWMFATKEALPAVGGSDVDRRAFEDVCQKLAPEDINERPTLAPSKRIMQMWPGYRKTLHGPAIATRIGLDRIAAACPHASGWFEELKQFALA